MKQNHTLFVMLWSLVCSSCYRDINLDSYKGKSQIVVNAIANGDTTLMADVSRSWFYTETQPGGDVADLSIEVYVNGEFRETMRYDGEKYQSDVRPQAGDELTLRTEVDGQEVNATERMPEKTLVENVEVTYRQVAGNGSMLIDPYGVTQADFNDEFTYHVRFRCQPAGRHYYFLRIGAKSDRYMLGDFDYSYDRAFQLTSERVNRSLTNQKIEGRMGWPFSDEGMDAGATYTLTVKETAAPWTVNDDEAGYREVMLYSISEAYYRYLVTLLSNDSDMSWQGGLVDIGLTEPVKVYSNIQGGTGVFGCVQKDIFRVNLFDFK